MRKTFIASKNKHTFIGFKFQELYYPLIMAIISIGLYWSQSIELIFAHISVMCVVMLYFFAVWKLKDLEIQVKFSPECIYDTDVIFGQINSLYGLVEGSKDNYAKFGWRCTHEGTIEILGCSNKEGLFKSKKLMECKHGEWLKLDLIIEKNNYTFVGENEDGEKAKVHLPRKSSFFFGKLFIYKLFPRFGDVSKTPREMSIEIIEKEK